MKYRIIIISLILSTLCGSLYAQNGKKEFANQFNPVTTGVTSLNIAPDARGGGLGDLGVASDPDVNSQFWNPAKYAFTVSRGGLAVSYTPWLRKLVNDINLAYVAGYWKFGRYGNDPQALSATLRYFSLGSIQTTDEGGNVLSSVNPYEMALDLAYSRKLTNSFSMAVALRFIYSDLGYSTDGSSDVKGAAAFAADIAGYQTLYPIVGRSECQWSWGFNISNIGTKVSYDGGANTAFLPANLRLGTTFKFPVADYHTLALNLDLNKLMVPTAPRQQDYLDAEGNYDQIAYQKALEDFNNMSSFKGIFKSFADAPGGFKEELQEIQISTGLEYSYNQQFFARVGYYYENKYKGNRQYLTFGAGFSLSVFTLDAAYVLATAQSSPLDQTLRFTLGFDMAGLKDLVGSKRGRR
ncbi:MAG: type IX secretion system outer membrane channel protein PorV [Bacteroidales bacterium]|nr:type IX secretion system outer membrane channel protein PorV [Bacteroidales bacterium]MBR5532625.1 type IX secretion system outer membrane channel protein PorV [Bacteroidales bacterium]